ncbi:MAG: DUF4136 domain-containing protein [Bacteroidota bacterium]
MNNLSKLIAVVSIAILGSCASSYNVSSDYDRSVNFRKYTSYRIVNDNDGKGDPILNSSINQNRINRALDAEMKARGYVAKENEADLIIKYQADSRDRQYTQSYGPTWGYWGMGSNSQTRTYEQGRLILNLIDAKTNQLVWQGWATGEVKNPNKDQEVAVRDQIYRILKQYPHRAGGGVVNSESTRRD